TFDFAFVDADKVSYQAYYEAALELLRPGGTVAFDNVLWSGLVVAEHPADPDAVALRAFNESLHFDEHIDLSLLPYGDGLTIAVKR
ncbi:methyltransferase, partial [Frankia casuarinae]